MTGTLTCAFTERMMETRSAVVISPRNSTSLPTMTLVMMPGNSLERRTASAACSKFLARLLESQMPWSTFSPPTLAAIAGTWSSPFSIE